MAVSSAAQTPVRLNARCSTRASSPKRRVMILSSKDDRSKNTSLIGNGKSVRKVKKRVRAVSTNEASPSTLELDYSEAAAKLARKDIQKKPCNICL